MSGALGALSGNGIYQVQGPPKIAVELCAPLHCMLAEAAALAPERISLLHGILVNMQMMQDVYFEVNAG
jgi:hypothetical protein